MNAMSTVIAILLSIGSAPTAQQDQPKRLTPSELSACRKQGGFAAPANMRGDQFCNRPLADAGRSCSDQSQCEGRCLVDPAKQRRLRQGTKTKGVCDSRTSGVGGCPALVVGGRYVQMPCAD